MSTGWSLIPNSSHVAYNEHGIIEVYFPVTASPVATTGGRYTIATFNKCWPSYGFITVAGTATTRNANISDSVAVMFGTDIKMDNFTGHNVTDVVIYALYYSVYLPT